MWLTVAGSFIISMPTMIYASVSVFRSDPHGVCAGEERDRETPSVICVLMSGTSPCVFIRNVCYWTV